MYFLHFSKTFLKEIRGDEFKRVEVMDALWLLESSKLYVIPMPTVLTHKQ
jgi:hypothetical protein